MVNRAEAAELARGNPLSFLHVVRSEIDLPADVDAYDPRVYARARDNLRLFFQEGSFLREPQPVLFVYELTWEGRSQVGVVGCVHVDDYASNVIRRHEVTRKDKEDDRTRHILTVGAHAEPVFLTYEGHPFVTRANTKAMAEAPLVDFTAPDDVRHRLWRATETEPYVDAFRRVDHAYVADGHHRCAGALRAAEEQRARGGGDEANWFLAVLFPSAQVRILPYHRVVRDLNGQDPEAFLGRLERLGTLAPAAAPSPAAPGGCHLFLAGRWYRFTFDPFTINPNDPIRSLDAALLQERVLEPLLGIRDIRTDPRVDFVGGIRGTAELERRVTSGEMAVAFAMPAVTVEQLMKVADAGAVMPPKSTWFEPKLRSGLFVHSLD